MIVDQALEVADFDLDREREDLALLKQVHRFIAATRYQAARPRIVLEPTDPLTWRVRVETPVS